MYTLQDVALLPLREICNWYERNEEKEEVGKERKKERNNGDMNYNTGGMGLRAAVLQWQLWRHYLNYYHRLIQTASVIAGHDRSLCIFVVLLSTPLQ